MKISGEIRNALNQLIDQHGNATQLARALDVAHTTVLAWINGRADEISGDVWYEKLEPKLRPFLGTPKDNSISQIHNIQPPASSLAFVQRMKRQRDLRPIEMAILEKLRSMNERQLARVYADLVYSQMDESAVLSAERESVYKATPKQWILLFPQMDDPSHLAKVSATLATSPKFKMLRQGSFAWPLAGWSLLPPAESSAFDNFLMLHFAQSVPQIVENLLPKSKPYCFVLEAATGLEQPVPETLKDLLPGEKFHISPYNEAAFSRCIIADQTQRKMH